MTVALIDITSIDSGPPGDVEKYEAYRAMLRAGSVPPPIIVRRRGDRWTVVDGKHRFFAARAEGVRAIAADETFE